MPSRTYKGPTWIKVLNPYYLNARLLYCPVDGPEVKESYLMNGFMDYHLENSFQGDWDDFFGSYKSGELPGMKLAYIKFLSETITFGEKNNDNADDPYMDLWPPEYGSDILISVDHAKHNTGTVEGGSNHAFADGSVRFLDQGASIDPRNLWGVTELFRDTIAAEF